MTTPRYQISPSKLERLLEARAQNPWLETWALAARFAMTEDEVDQILSRIDRMRKKCRCCRPLLALVRLIYMQQQRRQTEKRQ